MPVDMPRVVSVTARDRGRPGLGIHPDFIANEVRQFAFPLRLSTVPLAIALLLSIARRGRPDAGAGRPTARPAPRERERRVARAYSAKTQ
jgi:hypothetical protein